MMIGNKHTEETKIKMRASAHPWNKGKRGMYSKQSLQQMRIAKLGKPHSLKSREQRRIFTLGKLNPNYKHGKSRESARHYNDSRYKLWREAVYKRDNYTCQDCGKHGVYITAHHIKSWVRYRHLRYELSNVM